MGEIVMVMGESGSGKSTSLRNFLPGEVGVFNVAGKRLPFRGALKTADNVNAARIIERLGKCGPAPRAYVIDDSQYLMTFGLFDRLKDKGYDKFTEIGQSFYRVLRAAREKTPADCITYFLHHVEQGEGGRIKAKTIGKLLDNHMTLEGLFPIVLLARVDDGHYFFETNSDGLSTAKSPLGMFERRIPNDLKAADAVIREYWGMAPLTEPPAYNLADDLTGAESRMAGASQLISEGAEGPGQPSGWPGQKRMAGFAGHEAPGRMAGQSQLISEMEVAE